MTICPHCGWPLERRDGHACGDARIGRDRLRTLVEAEEALTALPSTERASRTHETPANAAASAPERAKESPRA